MHRNSELMFREFAVKHIADELKVLEIGPDKCPSTYQQCCNRLNKQWDTIDLSENNKQLTFVAETPYKFPINSEAYDVILSGQVIEHVPRIWAWMQEIVRITKQGGLVITIAPCSWPYHEAPQDCWRIYPDGMRALSEDAGLIVEFITLASLESPDVTHMIPGRSFEHQPQFYRELSAKLAALGNFPIEKSLDTICVARKPAPFFRRSASAC
jgi:SAM-dependent methyltransferase